MKFVVNKLMLDPVIIDQDHMKTIEGDWVNGKKVITYEYEYSGKQICLEAEVQALQTHNINRAIKSVWGVQNVTASDGKLSVH